ncbi:hypothetical protein [Ornithinimicrobium kibberense]|uniref:hypothetical protein n=1 Tax=Ornithinimicrobium kibberense TaxID=282060 RepID=UPI00360835FC
MDAWVMYAGPARACLQPRFSSDGLEPPRGPQPVRRTRTPGGLLGPSRHLGTSPSRRTTSPAPSPGGRPPRRPPAAAPCVSGRSGRPPAARASRPAAGPRRPSRP